MKNPGQCLCGDVSWEITAEPYQSLNCHCKLCRKAHGSAFATYWFLLPDQFSWTSTTGTIVRYRSSELLTRHFCGTCGSVVPYPSEQGEHVAVPAGCHDHGRKSDCEIFVAHRAPWYDITSNLPRYADYPPATGFARVEEDPAVAGQREAVPEGSAAGGCLCGAIGFHITEPLQVVRNCHCSRCRRGRSAAHATNGFVSLDGISFTRGQQHLKSYQPPDAEFFTQVFCEICGAIMPRLDSNRDMTVIPLGAMDDHPGRTPDHHIFVASKADWYDITDQLPRFDELPT